MGGSYCLLELNEHADWITAYLYIEEAVAIQLGSYMESEKTWDGQRTCLETSLKSINKEELWLEVRGVSEKREGVFKEPAGSEESAAPERGDLGDSESSSDLKIVLKLPDRLRVQDVLSVSYYRDSISVVMSRTQVDVSPIMFSRVVLSLKNKLSMLTISTLVSGIGWDRQYDLPDIEEDETVCLDLEVGSLSRLVEEDNPDMCRDGQCRLSVRCKGCGGLVSEYSGNWTTAPLPSEMFIHGSEMLTCDNCCPVFSESSGPSRCARDFGARQGWICLGQYHISVHESDILQDHLLFKEEPGGFEKTLEAFFISDINNIYYSSQKAFWPVSCKHCTTHIGWRNNQDNHINLWKSKVLLNAFSGDRTVLSLFANYSTTSLVAHYIEKYLKKYSKLYITESGSVSSGLVDAGSCSEKSRKEPLLSINVLKKNVIKLKTQLFAGLSYSEIESQICLSRKRSVLYNTIKISYEFEDAHVENGGHQILVEKEQVRHLRTILQENTLFGKNSHIYVPIFSSDLV